MRSPLQILVLPFRKNSNGEFEFAVFRRTDAGFWQGIAGGGEDNEIPEATAVIAACNSADVAIAQTSLRKYNVVLCDKC